MNQVENALFLLGSPRALNKSTSHSLGVYLSEALKEKGVKTSFLHIQRAFRSETRVRKLIEAFRRADLLILTCPLYVDSLPAPVIRCMELLAEHAESKKTQDKAFAAIINCGFPESLHTEIALKICCRFAQETGMRWQGGLGLGGGEAIAGKPLDQAGRLVRNVKRSLMLSAESLAEGRSLPEKAIELMSRPLIPTWLYKWFGNRGWKRQAKRYGTRKRLLARTFR